MIKTKITKSRKAMADAIVYLMVVILLILIIVLFFFIFKWRYNVIQNRISNEIELNDMKLVLINYLRAPISFDINNDNNQENYILSDLYQYTCNEGDKEFVITSKSNDNLPDSIKNKIISSTKETMENIPNKKNWRITCYYYTDEELQKRLDYIEKKKYSDENYAYVVMPLSNINLYQASFLFFEFRTENVLVTLNNQPSQD